MQNDGGDVQDDGRDVQDDGGDGQDGSKDVQDDGENVQGNRGKSKQKISGTLSAPGSKSLLPLSP